MKIALLTIDIREDRQRYSETTPVFMPAPEALRQGFASFSEHEVHVISCTQRPMKSPEKLADNIFFHSLHVPKIGWMRTLYQGCIRATRKKLQEIQPDIVHGQGTERDCAMAAIFSGFPNVLTIHGNMKAIAKIYHLRRGGIFWQLAAKLETFALKRTSGVFCNSAYTENLVAPRAKKVWRVPNAVRTEFFSPLTERGKNSRPVLLNVGVLEPRKRQLEILAAAKNLWRRGLNFEIHFAGDVHPGATYDEKFLRELATAEKEGRARHLGVLPLKELLAAMDGVDALVHFPTEESFGLVAAEALTRNLKLFTASVGGLVEIVDGVNGAELFPPDDFAALENSLARWMENNFPCPTAAAEIMRQRYLPEIIARRHLEIYREVLKTDS